MSTKLCEICGKRCEFLELEYIIFECETVLACPDCRRAIKIKRGYN